MEGISHEACSLAGTLAPRQADRPLRRQRHLDRRPDAGLVHRRHAAALRGLRLERHREGRRPRRRGGRCRDRGKRRQQHEPADADLLQDDHRQGSRRPRPAAPKSHGAALGEQGSRRDARGARLERIRRSRFPQAIYAGVERARARRRRRGRLVGRALPLRAPRIPSSPPSSRGAWKADCPTPLPPTARRARRRPGRQGRDDRHAQGIAAGDRGASPPCLPEMLGGSADLTGSVFTNWSGSVAGRPRRTPGNYVNYGVREFAMSAIANGVALHRRLHSLRRHVPHVLRLHAQCPAHGGADEGCARSSCSPTIRSAWARTGRRTSRSSTRRACA